MHSNLQKAAMHRTDRLFDRNRLCPPNGYSVMQGRSVALLAIARASLALQS